MRIFKRTCTFVSATVHDWFDRLEKPERLARHSLRELADALERATAAVAKSIAAERWLTSRRDEVCGQLDQWDRRAADAMHFGDESKARLALTQKFAATESLATLDRRIAEAAEVNRGLRGQLESMRDRYRQAKHRLDAQVSRHALVTAARQFADASTIDPGAGDVQAALDRFERSTLELEVEAELRHDVEPAAEWRDDRLGQFVEAELKRMRSEPRAKGVHEQ